MKNRKRENKLQKRKGWSRLLGIMMSIFLFGSVFPSYALTSEIETSKEAEQEGQDEQEQPVILENISEDKMVPEENYIEGEILVLYQKEEAVIPETEAVMGDSQTEEKSLENVCGIDNLEITRLWEPEMEWELNETDSESVPEEIDPEQEPLLSEQERETIESSAAEILLLRSDHLTTAELLSRVSGAEGVLLAEPNAIVHTDALSEDSYAAYQWALENQGQNKGTVSADLHPESLPQMDTSGQKVIAILDTGVFYTDPEFQESLWQNTSSRIKGTVGYDFVNKDTNPLDDNGHGTHVAGLLSARANNQQGIAGMASYADNLKLMILKFMDKDGQGDLAKAIEAYNYIYDAQRSGVNVVAVNNSWGGEEESLLLETVINKVGKYGAVSVCAAGNIGKDNDVTRTIPAGIDSKYIVSVAASNERDELASFSNYGKESVDLAAPGTDMLSLSPEPVFQPGLYSEEQREQLCSFYQNFEGKQDLSYKIEGSSTKNISVNPKDKSEFFGLPDENAAALTWTIPNAIKGQVYLLYFPMELNTNIKTFYLSSMVKLNAASGSGYLYYGLETLRNGSLSTVPETDVAFRELSGYAGYQYLTAGATGNYWTHISSPLNSTAKPSGSYGLIFCFVPFTTGSYELCFDDLAVSKENVSSELFGNYEYMSGTSMATPYVSAAVGLISNLYPQETAEGLADKVCGSVRRVSSLSEKLSSGGILDFSYFDEAQMELSGIAFDEAGNLVLNGYFPEGTMELQINGETVTIKERSQTQLKIENTGYENRYLAIHLIKGKQQIEKTLFASYQVKAFTKENLLGSFLTGGNLISDGSSLYYISEQSAVYSCGAGKVFQKESSLLASGVFSGQQDVVVKKQSEWVYTAQKLYAVYEVEQEEKKQQYLISYDLSGKQFSLVSGLPSDFHGNYPILGVYQGALYLIGGVDLSESRCLGTVYCYQPSKKSWSQSVSLPEGQERFFGIARQVGNRLVVTMGGNLESERLKNLVFNGTSWKESAVIPSGIEGTEFSYEDEENGTEVFDEEGNSLGRRSSTVIYRSQAGIMKNGLVYTGLEQDGMGDTWYYSMERDSFENAGYHLKQIKSEDIVPCASVGGKFYAVANDLNGENYLYSMGISDGTTRVAAVKERSTLIYLLSGTGVYLPGETIKLKVSMGNHYYFQKLLVNGKTYKKKEYSATAAGNGETISVDVTYGTYVFRLKLNKAKAKVHYKTPVKLIASVNAGATNKNLKWKSSNKKYATVSAKGVVKAKKAGIGKKVTITVTAKDRGKIKASCVVTLKKKYKVKKIRLSAASHRLKAGMKMKLGYTIKPSGAANAKVKFTSSNKAYASVTSDGWITAKKAGQKKTVRITVTAQDGSKKSSVWKLKIT